MSAKTKILVLRMKELIFTGVLIFLGILLLILLLVLFFPKESGEEIDAGADTDTAADVDTVATTAAAATKYTAGMYTSSVMLGDAAVDVQVILDEDKIKSISLVNLDETVETMYPLVKPAIEELSEQILAAQSTENITYSQNNQYTSLVLLSAIKDAIEKASLE
jgi:uncharacterized protein with FMN-binding domain